MSVLNIVLFCAAGFLLGVVISWLASNIASRLHNRTARRRTEPQVAGKKKGIKTMDLILVIIGVSLVWFTHRMLTLYETTGGIPDTLCQCVFALLGGECGVMGWIKTTKDKQQDRKWAEEDRQRMEREAQQPAQDFEPSFTAEQKNRDQYGDMTDDQIVDMLETDLCEYCEGRKGVVGQCDGEFCDEAIEAWKGAYVK